MDDEVVTPRSALKRCTTKDQLNEWIKEYAVNVMVTFQGCMMLNTVLQEIDRRYPDQVFPFIHKQSPFTDGPALVNPIMADMVLMALPNGHEVGFAMIIHEDHLCDVIPSMPAEAAAALPPTVMH